MTHSLHRVGDPEQLQDDFVILITPAIGVNDEGSGEKLRRILDILLEVGVANIGDVEHGSAMSGLDPATLRRHLRDGKRIRACISDQTKLTRILARLKREDVGLSVTVSGLVNPVFRAAREVGLNPHTINLSLGVRGRTARLPSQRVLEITTMCGHHMIASRLVGETLAQVRSGQLTTDAATKELGRLCVCGIFNPDRCRRLLDEAAGTPEGEPSDGQ
jgi:hypothetical protein